MKEYKFMEKSKLANILFTIELNKRLKEKGSKIETCSLHPGFVNTELMRHMTNILIVKIFYGIILNPLIRIISKNPMEGAQTNLQCCLSPNINSGAHYVDCHEKSAKLPKNYEEKATKLWNRSEIVINYKCKTLS